MASYNTKGSLQEKKTRSEVLSFTFALLIRPWTQNGIPKGVRRKMLPMSQVRKCVFAYRTLRFCNGFNIFTASLH